MSSSLGSPSNNPSDRPQLHLSIAPATTSFKRSFEQFGFDLDSPVGGGTTGYRERADAGGEASATGTTTGRNDRNKRARSASSLSDGSNSSDRASSSSGSSSRERTIASSSNTSLSVESEPSNPYPSSSTLPSMPRNAASSSRLSPDGLAFQYLPGPTLPPRIPTPEPVGVDMDIEMLPPTGPEPAPSSAHPLSPSQTIALSPSTSTILPLSLPLPHPPALPPLSTELDLDTDLDRSSGDATQGAAMVGPSSPPSRNHESILTSTPQSISNSTYETENADLTRNLERFNAFDSQIDVLRRTPLQGSGGSRRWSLAQSPREPTPPPTLPPLDLDSPRQHEFNLSPRSSLQMTHHRRSSYSASTSVSTLSSPSYSTFARAARPAGRSSVSPSRHRPEIQPLGSRTPAYLDVPLNVFEPPLSELVDVPGPSTRNDAERSPRPTIPSQPPTLPPIATTNPPPTLPPIETNSTVIWDAEEESQDNNLSVGSDPASTGDVRLPAGGNEPSAPRDFGLNLDIDLRSHAPPSPSLTDLRRWIDNGETVDSTAETRPASSHSAASVGSGRSGGSASAISNGTTMADARTSRIGFGRRDFVSMPGGLGFGSGNLGSFDDLPPFTSDGMINTSATGYGVGGDQSASDGTTSQNNANAFDWHRRQALTRNSTEPDLLTSLDRVYGILGSSSTPLGNTSASRPRVSSSLRDPTSQTAGLTGIGSSARSNGTNLEERQTMSAVLRRFNNPSPQHARPSSAAPSTTNTRPNPFALNVMIPDTSLPRSIPSSHDNPALRGFSFSDMADTSPSLNRSDRDGTTAHSTGVSLTRGPLNEATFGASSGSSHNSSDAQSTMFSAFRARRYSGLHAGGSLVAETSRERSRQRDELDLGVLRREPSTSRRSETSSLLGSRDLDAEDRGVFLPRRREEILNASRDTEMTDLARLFNSTDEPSSGRRPGESGESGRTGEARSAGTSTSTSTISRRAFNNWDFPMLESDSDSDDSLWRIRVPRPSMRRGQASLRPSSPQNRNTHVATSNTNPSDRPTSVTIPSVSIPPLHGDLISLRRYLDIQIGDDDASTRLSGEQLRTPVNRNPPSQAPPARPFLPIPVPSPNLDVEFGDRTGSSTRPGQGQSQSQQDDSTRSSISLNPPQPPSSRPSSSIENFRQAFRERGRQLSERNISRLLGHGSSGPSGLETPSAARPTNASNAGGSLASPLDLPSPHDPTGARFGFLYRRIGVPSDDPPSTGNPSNPSRAPDRLSDMFAPGPYQNTFRMLELERRRRMGEGEPSGSSTMSANARRFSTPSALSMPPHRPSPLSTAAPSIPPPPASTSQAAPTVPTLMSGMRVATATPHRYDASVTAGLGRAGRNAPPATTQSSDRPVRPLPLNPPSSHAIRPRPLHQHPTTVQRDPWERWLYEDSESDTSLDPLFVPRPRNGGPRTRGIDPLSAQAEELRRATRDLAQLHDDLSTLVAPRRRTYDVDGIELRHRPPAAANRNTPSASNSTTTTAPRHPGREEFRRRYLEIATLGGSGTEQPPERQTRPTGDAIRRVLHRAQRFGGFRRPLAGFNPGDFMNDDEFDDSYETLLSLTEELGEVRPRRTPANVIDSFTSASYSELANGESDKRCPICLDDYAPQDPVLKLDRCPHFMHKDCLKQWLNQATTCPVCREPVMEKKSPFMPPNRAPSASAAGPSTTSTSSSSRPRPDPLSFAMNRPRWPSELGSIRQIVPTRNPRIPEGSASLGFMPHPSRLSPINIRIGGPSRNNTNNNNNNNNNSSNSSDTNANNSHNPATGPPRGPQRPREDTSMDSDSSSDFMRF